MPLRLRLGFEVSRDGAFLRIRCQYFGSVRNASTPARDESPTNAPWYGVINFIAGRHDQPDERSRAQVFKQPPILALRPFIKHFLVVAFASPEKDVHVPEARAVAAVSFRGECRIDLGERAPVAAFTAPRETLRHHEHLDPHAVLLATFTPAGATALLRPPLAEFTGTTTV